MSTIDQHLARLRTDLRAAVQRDIRRRRRRHGFVRLVIIPAVALASAGVAVAFVAQPGQRDPELSATPPVTLADQLGKPAPKWLTARLDRDIGRMKNQVAPKAAAHINAPEGSHLSLVAVAESELIYGDVEQSGAWCAVNTTTTGELHGWVCHEASKAGRPDEVVFISMGGGGIRAENTVSGRVGQPSARTVHIHVPDRNEPIVTPLQRLGFFVAQLPDSVLRSQQAVPLVAEALDADGKVVARSSESLGG
jgi:hypothetical protein